MERERAIPREVAAKDRLGDPCEPNSEVRDEVVTAAYTIDQATPFSVGAQVRRLRCIPILKRILGYT